MNMSFKQEPTDIEKELLILSRMAWMERQFSSLLQGRQNCQHILKTDRFNIKVKSMLNKIQHDLDLLDPLIRSHGLQYAAQLEALYGIKFEFLVEQKEDPTPANDDGKMISLK